MSRHRTTLKMHRVRDKQANAKPPEAGATATESLGAKKVNGSDDGPSTQGEVLTAETLGRYLAAEVARRGSGEERAANALARYFKLTLVLAGLNMLVASASVVMVLTRSAKPPTIVVNQPSPPLAPATTRPPQSAEKAAALPPAALPAPMPPAVAPPAVVPPAPSPPAKRLLLGEPPAAPARIPLLGQPLSARKRAAAPSASRAPRVAVPKPVPSEPPVLAKNADEEEVHVVTQIASQATERW
jgi:hypothetical protein